ncbi:integrating conjugative element protein [Pseudomonas luteola]|uniref:Integrating conjugative element protein n=1 Tax=Pseudomonas luteola TaxID=47886 RepID=A0A2X2C9Z9_PSELU|nr:TIGR03758 family integrating conjugative element protein [Pseudomonas luteola]SPZ02566.1 integrating conjugative element protein [Pseudomonas luteola]
MSMTAAQQAAFKGNSGLTPTDFSTVFLGGVMALLLLWGVWAMIVAYKGWASRKLTTEKFAGLVGRFLMLYLVVGFVVLAKTKSGS